MKRQAASLLLLLAGAFPCRGNDLGASAGVTPQALVDRATAIVDRIKADEHYAKELRVAQAVLLLPKVGPGAGVGAGPGTQAVLVRHDRDGLWTAPAFVTVGGIGFAGVGAPPSGEGALLVMTERALGDFSRPRFTIGERSDLAVVGYVQRLDEPLGSGDVEIWSGSPGGLVGVALTDARFAESRALNRSYYGRNVGTDEIFGGDVANKGARALRKAFPL